MNLTAIPIQAFDTAQLIDLDKGQELYAAGYRAAGCYARPDRLTPEMVKAIHQVGMKIFSIGERGQPISDQYFTAEQAKADATFFAEYALTLGQPSETTFSPCLDYDAKADVDNAYLSTWHDVMKSYGYYTLVYADWIAGKAAVDAGIAVGVFLPQSTGFEGWAQGKDLAAIVQSIVPGGVICGLAADPDTIRTPVIEINGLTINVLW